MVSDKPPIHLNPNMDNQQKYKAQSAGKFFADGSAQRMPVPGTVMRGQLRADRAFYEGVSINGDTLTQNPLPITPELLARGKERYGIYCGMCHGVDGKGQGIVIQKGFVRPPDYHDPRVMGFSDGNIYNVITHGVRNMSSYAMQVPPEDRWAIVAHVRTLQGVTDSTKPPIPTTVASKPGDKR